MFEEKVITKFQTVKSEVALIDRRLQGRQDSVSVRLCQSLTTDRTKVSIPLETYPGELTRYNTLPHYPAKDSLGGLLVGDGEGHGSAD